MTTTVPAAKKGGGAAVGWTIIGLIVVALIALGRNGGSPTSNETLAEQSNVAQAAISDRLTEAPKPPVEALNAAAVRQGRDHVRLVAVEGLSGQMIYSQNCWDGLTRRFTWSQLDTCGAFDSTAATALGDTVAEGLDKEIAWFDAESAAGRYLKAATAAGEAADEADQRLADLQARLPKARAAATAANESSVPTFDEFGNEIAPASVAPGGSSPN